MTGAFLQAISCQAQNHHGDANPHMMARVGFGRQRSNTALQTDKVKHSCLLHSQKLHQLAFAAELDR